MTAERCRQTDSKRSTEKLPATARLVGLVAILWEAKRVFLAKGSPKSLDKRSARFERGTTWVACLPAFSVRR